ncbi:MAG: hypothetical protein KBG28_01850 [Kofleriaceae bacterium]|nr:hypothetical protein [Kofleriaceae bacterium]MBP6841010.1 hypothetical protein [Kofleriaceae bacterium]MBP9202698.1 hypothetical protein [Kofleriaceae bacterium]
MATDRLAPVIDVVFAGRGVDDPAGRFDLADEVHAEFGLRYWLGKRPWVELGAGVGAITLRDPQDQRAPPNSGALFGLAAAYELASWQTFALVVVADAGIILGDERALSAGLSVGLDWWYYDLVQ